MLQADFDDDVQIRPQKLKLKLRAGQLLACLNDTQHTLTQHYITLHNTCTILCFQWTQVSRRSSLFSSDHQRTSHWTSTSYWMSPDPSQSISDPLSSHLLHSWVRMCMSFILKGPRSQCFRILT